MGYIPPPGEGKGPVDGNNNGSGGSNGSSGVSGGSGSGSGSGGTVITIPNPAAFTPQNPSIGLKLFGPLVPASDNIGGLYFLTAFQFSIGCICIGRARQLRKSRLFQLNIPNTFLRRVTKYSCLVGGGYLSFQSGLEVTRLLLPYDPWVEEAKYYRRVAKKNGDSPSWWWGATGYYKPMSFKVWNERVQLWITNTENKLELEIELEQAAAAHKNTSKNKNNNNNANSNSNSNETTKLELTSSNNSALLGSLAKKGRYSEIYEQLHETNVKRFETLLTSDLKDVFELNKAERIDLILEGKGPVQYNPNYNKPHIQLGNHLLETDDDFEVAWLNFEPWDELKLETEYDIRLIPKWRWEDQEIRPEDPNPKSEDPSST